MTSEQIETLRKTVASVTQQKQELELQNNRLQQNLSAIEEKLSTAQEENNKLRKQLGTAQNDLEQERKRNSGFGQNVLKNLSSLMPNGDQPSGEAPALSVSDEDRLVAENQRLHKELKTLRLKYDTDLADSAKQEETVSTKKEREVEELRTLLYTVTTKCDELNAQCARDSACIDFCRHYLTLSINKKVTCEDAPFTVILSRNKDSAVTASSKSDAEDAQNGLLGTCSFWRTLLGSVSVFLIALRDGLPLSCRGTSGDTRCLTDRLATLLEAHQSEKDNLLFIIGRIEEAAGKEMSPGLLMQVQDEGLQALVKWIALMRSHVALLIESTVAYLPHGETFHLTESAACGGKPERRIEVANRDEFVDALTSRGSEVLSVLAGSLDALVTLLNTTTEWPSAVGGGAAGSESPDAASRWLLSLQYFLWEGSTQCTHMRASARALAAGCDDIAAVCNHSQMRDSLTTIGKALRLLAVPCAAMADDEDGSASTETRRFDNGYSIQTREQLPLTSSSNRYHYEDLLTALASADQTAVCLHAHNNALLVELAAAKDYQRKLEGELHVARTSLHAKEAESQQTETVLQDQIRALSHERATAYRQ